MKRRVALAHFLAAASAQAWPALALGQGQGQDPSRANVASTRPVGPGAPATPAHAPFGPIRPPVQPPDIALLGSDGRAVRLRGLMAGRPTALQLMFTGCSATCPIQGAVFAEAARQLRATELARKVQLVSFSIDALGDSPAALQAWMERHGADPAWRAVVPREPRGVDAMTTFLRAGREGPDPHTGQVHVFDRAGRWIFKSPDLPSAREIADWLTRAARP